MNKINATTYVTVPNELVTIHIDSIGVPPVFVTLELDGQVLTRNTVDDYTFRITKPVGETHFVGIWTSFPPETPDSAKFEVAVSGSEGGRFSGPIIEKASPEPVVCIAFNVASNGTIFTGPRFE